MSEPWNGEVVTKGKINGCTLTLVDDSLTDWIITIDGVQADLGKFSEAIYKKLLADAKKNQFQGFRAGTVPPHLLPTYKAYTMDECARESTLEAMQQNSIRPFDSARQDFMFTDFSIPPVVTKKGKGKKKKQTEGQEEELEPEPQWRYFATMKEALDAGWMVRCTANSAASVSKTGFTTPSLYLDGQCR
jgi:Bacterial trigger factor protein (TF)